MPAQQAKSSSHDVSPSSSSPLQTSPDATQVPMAQPALHVAVPGAPVGVVQDAAVPAQQE
jgi:hypothetical protein